MLRQALVKGAGSSIKAWPHQNHPKHVVKGATKAPNAKNYDNNIQRDRWRFRLRLNADFKLAGNFFGGVQLSTSDNRDAVTGNATLTGGYDNYSIYISR